MLIAAELSEIGTRAIPEFSALPCGNALGFGLVASVIDFVRVL
jgi:hypothetical protein